MPAVTATTTDLNCFTYQTCESGCHDVCDLLLLSMTKLQQVDRTLRGRFRSQMRRQCRPLVDRVLMQNSIKRLCDIMTREAGAGDDEACGLVGSLDTGNNPTNGIKRSATEALEPVEELEVKKLCRSSDSVDSCHSNNNRQRRLTSMVLVTENFKPVRLSSSAAAAASTTAGQTKGRFLSKSRRRRLQRLRQRQRQRRHLTELVARRET